MKKKILVLWGDQANPQMQLHKKRLEGYGFNVVIAPKPVSKGNYNSL